MRVTIYDGEFGAGSSQVITASSTVGAVSASATFRAPGMDLGGPSPATATVRLDGDASAYLVKGKRQRLILEGEIDGNFVQVFDGLTTGYVSEYFPLSHEINASGYLSLAQRGLKQGQSYHASNGFGSIGAIIRDLLDASGITDYSVADQSYTVYTTSGHVLRVRAGEQALNAIAELTRFLVPIFDTPDGTVESVRSFTGSYSSDFTYVEGAPGAGQDFAWNWKRPLIDQNLRRDLIRVLGYVPNDPSVARAYAGRRASSSWDPDRYTPHEVNAEALEVSSDCAALASAFLTFLNRQPDIVEFTGALNPYLKPMVCIDVTAGSIGASGQYQVLSVRHDLWPAYSTVTALSTSLAGAGSSYSLAPVPAFDFTKTIVTTGVGIYTITWAEFTCDGSGSTDAEGQDTTDLTMKWSANVALQQKTGIGATVLPDGSNPTLYVFRIPQSIDILNNTIVTLEVQNRSRISASVSHNV